MVILITGGASGLGESVTRKLAAAGSDTIYFTYNSSENNANKIVTDYSNAFAIKCDFQNKLDVNDLIAKINNDINLDVLINNAYSKTALNTHFHKINHADFLTDFEVNLMPAIAITQQAIKNFRKKKSGKIITILTSSLVNLPPLGMSVYTANKAYLEQLTKVWATENVRYNIVSNSVSPALMRTNLTSEMDGRTIEQMVNEHPLKRLLTTDEVAETVHFLVNATHQLNGVNIVVNSAANIK